MDQSTESQSGQNKGPPLHRPAWVDFKEAAVAISLVACIMAVIEWPKGNTYLFSMALLMLVSYICRVLVNYFKIKSKEKQNDESE